MSALKVALVILAASAVASAEPPRAPAPKVESLPRPTAYVLAPPGLTPTIHEMYCVEDPNEKLRTDCFTGDNDHTPVTGRQHAVVSHVWPDYSDRRNPSDPDRGRANLAPLPSPPARADWQPAPLPRR